MIERVLCVLEGTRCTIEAVRQAATLADGNGTLRLLAVTWEGSTMLPAAHEAARRLGLEAEARQAWPRDPAAYVLEQAPTWDLVVVEPGDIATTLVRHSPVPVLVVREAPPDALGDSVLLAVDGSGSCLTAAAVAAVVAAGRGGQAAIVAAPSHDGGTREVLARSAAELRTATGVDPVILDENGPADRDIIAAAQSLGATLIVTGSRDLDGVAADESVSLRVAEEAACSVLVVRGRAFHGCDRVARADGVGAGRT
jgi:nucleotide-binding universal stress UspA family protein